VKVPAVKGQPEDAARSAIQAKGLEAEVKTKSVPVGDPNTGRVIEVDPAAGTLVDPGSTVTITVGVASAASTTTSPASTTTSP
jgi:beta-lactam-binding protein with PASTA domain